MVLLEDLLEPERIIISITSIFQYQKMCILIN